MRLVDIVNNSDKVIGQVILTTCHANGILHRGAGVFIFNNPNKTALLLQKRSVFMPNSSKWCTPGGHLLVGEDYETAARRECLEEVFHQLQPTHFLLKFLFNFKKDDPQDKEFISMYELIHSGPFNPNLHEVSELKFFSIAEIKQLIQERPTMFSPAFQKIWQQYNDFCLQR